MTSGLYQIPRNLIAVYKDGLNALLGVGILVRNRSILCLRNASYPLPRFGFGFRIESGNVSLESVE